MKRLAIAIGRRLAFVTLVVMSSALASCSGACAASEEERPQTTTDDIDTHWAIHFYAGPAGSRRRVDVAPLTSSAQGLEIADRPDMPALKAPQGFPAKPTGSNGINGKGSPAPSKKEVTVVGADGGTTLVGSLDVTKTNAWVVLAGAAYECGIGRTGDCNATTGECVGPPEHVVIPPWSSSTFANPWYIFKQPPATCDELVRYEQILGCIADKLDEVADAVGNVTWANVPPDPPSSMPPGFPKGPWVFPPQRNADRFILRDLAINVLANLALTDVTRPTNAMGDSTPKPTCSDAYAEVAINGPYAELHRNYLFGLTASPFDPAELALDKYKLGQKLPLTTANLPDISSYRLGLQTHVLRSSGRTLQEVIRKSVYADLAGAELRRARSTDPLRGNRLVWAGVDDPNDQTNNKFNSLAHAVRVLEGRWEIGPALPPTVTTPLCGGVAPMDLLRESYGADLTGREQSIPVNTQGQRAAIAAVNAAGMVVPDAIANAQTGPALKQALKDQLIANAAKADGVTPSDSALLASRGKSIAATVDALDEADVRFALHRSFALYRLASNTGETTPLVPGATVAGMSPPTYLASSLSSIGGTAFNGGLPTSDLTIDVRARTAGIQEASQCAEVAGMWGAYYADAVMTASFQNAFAIGQTLWRRLTVARVRADQVSGSLSGSAREKLQRVVTAASLAAAEHRSWAGPGAIIAQGYENGTGVVGTTAITTIGFTLSDFGVDSVAAATARIKLVHGEPWVADCVAGVRSTCPPASVLADHTVDATYSDAWQGPLYTRDSGTDGFVGYWEFPGAGAKAQYNPTYLGSAKNTSGKHLYVVLTRDPKAHSVKGAVLGTIALRNPYEGTMAVVSTLQRDLLESVLGFGDKPTAAKGDDTVAYSPSYCIDGVPRNLFVPLENELTGDSDQYENSWKHYLTLAANAAKHADDLGREMIDIGLRQDFRREAAQEELARVCGNYTTLDKVTASGGKVQAPKDDAALASCLSADKVDVVLLTNDPVDDAFDKSDDAKRTAFLKQKVLECTAGDPNELCSKPVLSYAALGIAGEWKPKPPTTTPAECELPVKLVESLATGFRGADVSKVASASWMNAATLKARARALRLSVSGGDWQVTHNGSTLMHSGAGSGLWPGCQRSDATVACASGNPAPAIFRRIFLDQKAAADPLSADDTRRILWNVEGAIFLLHAMTGEIPQGAFGVPVPAVDFADADWGSIADLDRVAPAATVYGKGRFVATTGDDANFDPTSGTSADAKIMEGSKPLTFTFPTSAFGVPTWLRNSVYANAAFYRQLVVPNDETKGFRDPDGNGGVEALSSWAAKTGTMLGTLTCKTAGGVVDFAAASSGFAEAIARIRDRKLAGDVLSVCPDRGSHRTHALRLKLGADGVSMTSEFRDSFYYHVAKNGWGQKELDAYRDSCYPFEGKKDGENADEQSKLVPLLSLGHAIDAEYISGYQQYTPICGRFEDVGSGGGGCTHAIVDGVHSVKSPCAKDTLVQVSSWESTGSGHHGRKQYTERVLLPQVCSPSQRVLAFVNSYFPPNACAAAAQFAQAIAMACEIGHSDVFPISDDPPPILGKDDVPALARWTKRQSTRLADQVSRLHLERIPKSVVDQFVGGTVKSSIGGEAGDKRAQAQQALTQIATNINRASASFAGIGLALDAAHDNMKLVELNGRAAELNLLRARIGVLRDMAMGAARLAGAILSFIKTDFAEGSISTATAAASLGFGWKELSTLDDLAAVEGDKTATELRLAINKLQQDVRVHYNNLNESLLALRAAVSHAMGVGRSIATLESKAQYEAAKGAGLDYFTDPSTGKVVPIVVNTVLRRQYGVAERRYKRALADAKYLAYVARLAIEQRIGVRLNTITTNVGALKPPAQWADDICSLTGVDYKKLRTFGDRDKLGDAAADDALAAHENEVIAEFADQYVGDYVTKLLNFIEYYNIQYPSKEGDDVALVSMQDDFGSCVKTSPNLLVQSAHLERSGPAVVPGTTAGGWARNECDAKHSKCLRVETGLSVASAPLPPVAAALSGHTWLHDVPLTFSGDAGTVETGPPSDGGDPLEGTPSSTPSIPKQSVGQIVSLEPGPHVLSWWDQARALDGAAPTGPGAAYRVQVLDATGVAVASFDGTPEGPDASGAAKWSARRKLSFTVKSKGLYVVTFRASLEGSSMGSLLVSNVQLEADPAGAGPTPYVGTAWTRTYLTNKCEGAERDPIQKKFEHRCEKGKCFHELVAPLLIDTSALSTGGSPYAGKLAADNFNFRHMTLAINLVGTGVRDCAKTPSPSCYGSGYVEYTLTHEAFNSGVVGWDGNTQFFNFGGAAIRHGKALAAERFITLPLSSADSSLLFTPATEKQELRGRPLDGGYRLRIFDNDALQWANLKDVQIVLKYRYWSVIQPQPAGG